MSFYVTYLRIKRVNGNDEECFLCTLEDEIESRYLDTYLSELIMDASSRQKIIESRGFCTTISTKCSLQQASLQVQTAME